MRENNSTYNSTQLTTHTNNLGNAESTKCKTLDDMFKMLFIFFGFLQQGGSRGVRPRGGRISFDRGKSNSTRLMTPGGQRISWL